MEKKMVASYKNYSVFSGSIQMKKVKERKKGVPYSIQSEWRVAASISTKFHQ